MAGSSLSVRFSVPYEIAAVRPLRQTTLDDRQEALHRTQSESFVWAFRFLEERRYRQDDSVAGGDGAKPGSQCREIPSPHGAGFGPSGDGPDVECDP